MTPARSLRSAALSRLSHESAATPTSASGTPGTTASPFSKQHPGLLKCLTFYRTQSGLLWGAGTPNLCFFFYKQKDDSCRSTGTTSADRQVNHPSFYSLSSGHLGKCQLQVQKSSKEKPSCQTSQVHLASSPLALLPTFWALRLLGGFGGENRGACYVPAGTWLPVSESTSPTTLYHTSPNHSTLARPGFCNQPCV